MSSEHFILHQLEWQDPLGFCHSFMRLDSPCALLYSGLKTGYSGNYSIFAFEPIESISSAEFEALETVLSDNQVRFENFWFGFLGYELLHGLESIPRFDPSIINMPELWFARFASVVVWNHEARTMTGYQHPYAKADLAQHSPCASNDNIPAVSVLLSSMTKTEYQDKVSVLINAIHAGELYQANLTRKFFGQFESAPDSFGLFRKLCAASPAPYSAYIQTPHGTILSSSPEKFLTISEDGHIETRPIKGTARRNPDPIKDTAAREALRTSTKDRAENLMIVDLMRNDLSRIAKNGCVKVENLFDVASFATVHHMDSTITATKREDICTLDVVKACFPPGSMTGAPKIKAMQLCSKLEGMQRGVYSGALGWFGGDGSCDLSVVIRTLVVKNNQFEFQVGGGIVADSTPDKEWAETITKALGILKTLGLEPDAIEKL